MKNYISKIWWFPLSFLLCHADLSATSWNEPWQEEIIREAQFFIKGQIIEHQTEQVKVQILTSFGPQTISGELDITNFYLLDLCSRSAGHGPNFEFLAEGDVAYFFLKKSEKGSYELPTPSSGFDKIEGDNVYATYRHSYHQALVTTAIYEETMQAIWNYYHNQDYNQEPILRFLRDQLSIAPAGLEESELTLFFKQHVALELIYHLRLDYEIDQIIPFLSSENFHAQISAVRALASSKSPQSLELLIELLKDSSTEDFCKTLAIEAIQKQEWKKHRKQLKRISRKLSNESTGFGGNLMDPRICTTMDPPKQAIYKLLGKKKRA